MLIKSSLEKLLHIKANQSHRMQNKTQKNNTSRHEADQKFSPTPKLGSVFQIAVDPVSFMVN